MLLLASSVPWSGILDAELEEEGCIRESDIEESYLRSIYLGTKTGIGFYFEIILNVSLKELEERFKRDNKDQDIKSLEGFSRDEYLSILKNHRSKNKQLVIEMIQI